MNITQWKTTIIGILGILASFGVIASGDVTLIQENLPALLAGINAILAIVLGFVARD